MPALLLSIFPVAAVSNSISLFSSISFSGISFVKISAVFSVTTLPGNLNEGLKRQIMYAKNATAIIPIVPIFPIAL